MEQALALVLQQVLQSDTTVTKEVTNQVTNAVGSVAPNIATTAAGIAGKAGASKAVDLASQQISGFAPQIDTLKPVLSS